MKIDMTNYKRDLDYLHERLILASCPEEHQTLLSIIDTVRDNWFRQHDDAAGCFSRFDWSTPRCRCDVFLFDNWAKALRKFNNFWYAVDVESRDGSILVTKTPDDYLCEGIRLTAYDYPEYFMAEYFEKLTGGV